MKTKPRFLVLADIFAQFEEWREAEDPLKQSCQTTIQRLLKDSIYVPNHYAKLRWLAIYWNATVGLGSLDRINLPVAENFAGLMTQPHS